MTLSDADRSLIAMTVVLEAEGETQEGKVAVARVIRNRMESWRQDASTVVLQHYQFSAWNDDAPRRLALSRLFGTHAWADALAAVDTAFGAAPDPTHGATHYLNEAATRAGRHDHMLPAWFNEKNVTVRIGAHTFLV